MNKWIVGDTRKAPFAVGIDCVEIGPVDEAGDAVGLAFTKEGARLMAAAPELYAALKALRDAVHDHGSMDGREYVGLGIQVNNALAKAVPRS